MAENMQGAPTRIVFHGENAAAFSGGFSNFLEFSAAITVLPDVLTTEAEREAYATAKIIVGVKYDGSLAASPNLKLFHVPGAGYDAVNLTALPGSAVVCNCFGHEQAIAEYVMAALLARHIPLQEADQRLRRGDWAYWAGSPDRVHDELAEKTIGLLGFGHIGKAVAVRAKAFEMRVHVANRSKVEPSPMVDRSFTLDQLPEFWPSADFFVVSLPLTPETTGIVGGDAFAAMRPNAVVANVGRGPLIDERALYEALQAQRIGGAIIDTWYRYPSPVQGSVLPSALPFHELPNIVMTPHMSGWTRGTIRRRQQTIAENIMRLVRGEPCVNVVREARSAS